MTGNYCKVLADLWTAPTVCRADRVGIKSQRQHKTLPRARLVTTLEKTPHYLDETHSADSKDHYGSPVSPGPSRTTRTRTGQLRVRLWRDHSRRVVVMVVLWYGRPGQD